MLSLMILSHELAPPEDSRQRSHPVRGSAVRVSRVVEVEEAIAGDIGA